MARPAEHRVQFGPFRLDASERVLLRDGSPIHLPDKALDTLLELVQDPGKLLTKEQLLDKVWPGTFVEEATLAQNVFRLRRVLGTLADGREYIETVPKHGYRFVATVREVSRDEPAAPPAAISPWGARSWPLAAACSILLIAAIALYLSAHRTKARAAPPAGRIMMAVLPFANLTGNPQQDYLSDGLTEEMIDLLGRVQPARLGIIARTSVMQYKNSAKPIREISEELGVRYVVQGSVRRAGSRVRVSAQLIQASDQTQLLAEDFQREIGDVLGLQSDVARAIVSRVELNLSPREEARLTGVKPVNPDAYEDYLNGLFYWNQRSDAGRPKARQYFRRAVALDPNFALAFAALGETYAGLPPAEDPQGEAESAVRQALRLDDSLAEAHAAYGILLFFGLQWREAEREFCRGIELNPNAITPHLWYAALLQDRGRFNEAIAEADRASELDPLSPVVAQGRGTALYFARRNDEAEEQLLKTLELDPGFLWAYLRLAQVYVQQGRYSEAEREFQHARAVRPGAELLRHAHLLALTGHKVQALEILRVVGSSTKDANLFDMAAVFAALSDSNRALDSLNQAFADHHSDLLALGVDPRFDPLRSDPRFRELLHRIGLAH